MKLDELIAKLNELRAQYGPNIVIGLRNIRERDAYFQVGELTVHTAESAVVAQEMQVAKGDKFILID